MIHNQSFAHSIPYIVLVLALLAVSVLVVNLAQPLDVPARYASSNDTRPALSPGEQANAARWQARADAYNLQRSRQAEIARWQSGADAYNRQRAREAEIARWQGGAIAYYMQQSGLSRGQLADAARWSAMAIRYGLASELISPQLQFLLGK